MTKVTCPKCKKDFLQTTKHGYTKIYCSRSCANSRTHLPITKKKISKKCVDTWNTKTEDGKQKALKALQMGRKTIKKKC